MPDASTGQADRDSAVTRSASPGDVSAAESADFVSARWVSLNPTTGISGDFVNALAPLPTIYQLGSIGRPADAPLQFSGEDAAWGLRLIAALPTYRSYLERRAREFEGREGTAIDIEPLLASDRAQQLEATLNELRSLAGRGTEVLLEERTRELICLGVCLINGENEALRMRPLLKLDVSPELERGLFHKFIGADQETDLPESFAVEGLTGLCLALRQHSDSPTAQSVSAIRSALEQVGTYQNFLKGKYNDFCRRAQIAAEPERQSMLRLSASGLQLEQKLGELRSFASTELGPEALEAIRSTLIDALVLIRGQSNRPEIERSLRL